MVKSEHWNKKGKGPNNFNNSKGSSNYKGGKGKKGKMNEVSQADEAWDWSDWTMSSTAWDASDAWWHADGSEWWYEGWGDQSATEYRTDWDANQTWQESTVTPGQTGTVGSLIISPCLAESSDSFGSAMFQFVEEDVS